MLDVRETAAKKTASREKGRPIFRSIFTAMMIILVVEVVLMVASISITNVTGRLNQTAKYILSMQVRNRVAYMQDTMQKAQDLSELSNRIDHTVLAMVENGTLALNDLNTAGEASDALLAAIAPELVDTLRARPVSGIFVVLNTQNLRTKEVGTPMAGIYLRDLDPDARASEENADLMIERGV